MNLRNLIIRFLLGILNSRFLNGTPCKFAFIGNVDAFSIENLRSEVSQRPDVTVAQILKESQVFSACPLGPSGFTVIEGGVAREGTLWDIHELRMALGDRLSKDAADKDVLPAAASSRKPGE